MKRKSLLMMVFLLLTIFGGLVGCSQDYYKDDDFIVVKRYGHHNRKIEPILKVHIEVTKMDETLNRVEFLTATHFQQTYEDYQDNYGQGEYFPGRIGNNVYIIKFLEIKKDYVPQSAKTIYVRKNHGTLLCTCEIVKTVGEFSSTEKVEEVLLTGIENYAPALTTDSELGNPDSEAIIPKNLVGMKDLQNFINRYNLSALITADETTKRYVSFKSQGMEKDLTNWWYTSEIYLNGSKATIFFFQSHENQGKGLTQIKVNDRIFLLSTDIGVVSLIQYNPENQFAKTDILSEIKPSKNQKLLSLSTPANEQFVEIKRLLDGSEPFEELKRYIEKNKLILVLIEPSLSEKLVPNSGRAIKYWEWKVFRGNRYYYVFSSGTPEVEFRIESSRYLWWGESRILHLNLDELNRFQAREMTSLPSEAVSNYPVKDDLIEVMIEDTGAKFTARYGSLATESKKLRIIVNDWIKLENAAQLIVYFSGKKVHRGIYVDQVIDGTGNKVLILKISQ